MRIAIKGAPFFRHSVTQTRPGRSLSLSLAFSKPKIIMLIIDENIVRDEIFKNASIPFTCRPFSESAILRRVARMRLFRTSAVLFPIHFSLISQSLRRDRVSIFSFFTASGARSWIRHADATRICVFILDARQTRRLASEFYLFNKSGWRLKNDKRY